MQLVNRMLLFLSESSEFPQGPSAYKPMISLSKGENTLNVKLVASSPGHSICVLRVTLKTWEWPGDEAIKLVHNLAVV